MILLIALPDRGLHQDKGVCKEVERFICRGDMGDMDEFLIERLTEVNFLGLHARAVFGA